MGIGGRRGFDVLFATLLQSLEQIDALSALQFQLAD
jgi:hypothetical protein